MNRFPQLHNNAVAHGLHFLLVGGHAVGQHGYGRMFAETDHGDVFVFDVSSKDGNYPVFWFDHEQNSLEPFASNFAECIKRFSQKN